MYMYICIYMYLYIYIYAPPSAGDSGSTILQIDLGLTRKPDPVFGLYIYVCVYVDM